MKSKLLSPAGEINSGYAAVHYGADEVYLGLKQFSARGLAKNFTPEELAIFTGYAHSKNVKVCLTLNTLVQERYIPNIVDLLTEAKKAAVDAIIVQDFGIVKLINTYFKNDFAVHASTQMAIHNLKGAESAEKLGIKRIVLARELSLSEIEHIVKNTTLETEVFIHGAMCYSYSGLCMFSALKKGLSGNKGLCSYSCRDSYDGKFSFSMKDLWVGEDVKKLQDIGVTALKIEGRRKNPLYVAAVTDYYRKILDGKDAHAESNNLKIIFSRGNRPLESSNIIDDKHTGHKGLLIGKILKTSADSITFKSDHAFGRYDGIKIESENQRELFGFPVKNIKVSGKKVSNVRKGDTVELILGSDMLKNQKITKDDKVYLASESKIKASYPYFIPKEEKFVPKIPLDIKIIINRGIVKANSMYSSAEISPAKSGETANPSLVVRNAEKSFAKTMSTPFTVRNIEIQNPKNIYVSVSDFNNLRDRLLDFDAALARKEITPPVIKPFTFTASVPQPVKWLLKTRGNPQKYAELTSCFDEIIVDIDADITGFDKNKLRFFMPTVDRGNKAEKRSLSLYKTGFRKFMIDNIYGLHLFPKDADLTAYYDLYCMNRFAVFDGMPFTVSPEDDDENIAKLLSMFKEKVILPVVYNPPLFVSGNPAFPQDEKELKNYLYTTYNGTHYLVEKKQMRKDAFLSMPDASTFMIDLTFTDLNNDEIKDIVKR